MSTVGALAYSLGKYNLFLYRSYIYDKECGLYYLQSRYYAQEIMRFLNADEFINVSKCILSHNLFAYCINTPVASYDENGHFLKTVLTAVVVATTIIKAAKAVIQTIGAELQLVVNRSKAKKALKKSGEKQMDYLVNYPYGGASNSIFEGVFGKYEWFYNQVNHNAPMDYKREHRRPWWSLGCDKFYFRGKMITFEEYGNLNFGYVGKALGIPDWIIFAGGGFAAVTGGGDTSWRIDYFFDSEEDHDSVAWGIDIYNSMWGSD